MKRLILLFIVFTIFSLVSCSKENAEESAGLSNEQRVEFLFNHNVNVDTARPYYSSISTVPNFFNTVWRIREIFSSKSWGIELSEYKGRQCHIYMYPVTKLPFEANKGASSSARAVVISCGDVIACSYIEFISELRSRPPTTLDGRSISDLTQVAWDIWKGRMDNDDNKALVIFQYYNALRAADYDEAYSYIYDRDSISREDFVNTAKQNSLPYMDFLSMDQYREPTDNECYFLVKADVSDGSKKKKTFQITFDLKRDPAESSYGGWKIYKTEIK